MKFFNQLQIPVTSTLSTPDSGFVTLGIKSDGKLYRKNSSGTETTVETGGVTIQAGRTVVTTDGSAEAVITFPTAFASAPAIVANATTGGRGCTIVASSTTSFTVQVWHWSTGLATSTSNTIHWHAMVP